MNEHGNPESLIASQPGNLNAAKAGVYSPRLRARRAEEIAEMFAGQSLLEVARQAVAAEVPVVRELGNALLREAHRLGVSSRAGAARSHLGQLSRVSRQQLDRLARATWLESSATQTPRATGPNVRVTHEVPLVGDDLAAGADHEDDPQLEWLRARLWLVLAIRDLYDKDLAQSGVVTRTGAVRRSVGERLGVSRDLVQVLTDIDAALASTAAAPTSTWEVAHDLAFRPGTSTACRLRALKILLKNPPPTDWEVSEFEREVRRWSPERVEAELANLRAGLERGPDETQESAVASERVEVPEDEAPLDPAERVREECLAVLRRITRGDDPHASDDHRLQAATLYEKYLSRSSGISGLEAEVRGMSEEQIDIELEELRDRTDWAE